MHRFPIRPRFNIALFLSVCECVCSQTVLCIIAQFVTITFCRVAHKHQKVFQLLYHPVSIIIVSIKGRTQGVETENRFDTVLAHLYSFANQHGIATCRITFFTSLHTSHIRIQIETRKCISRFRKLHIIRQSHLHQTRLKLAKLLCSVL